MCFWKVFHLILMHVFHKIQCFEEFLHYSALFFIKLFFPEFRPIEMRLKMFVSLCLFRSIESIFWSIENRLESFLKKNLILTCSTYFSKSFQTLSLSLRSVKAQFNFFCSFPPILLQGFSPLRSVRLFYPSFCIYFQVSCIFWGNFEPIDFWGFFDDSSLFSSNWSMGLCSKIHRTVLDGLIWFIWWFVRNWKF